MIVLYYVVTGISGLLRIYLFLTQGNRASKALEKLREWAEKHSKKFDGDIPDITP